MIKGVKDYCIFKSYDEDRKKRKSFQKWLCERLYQFSHCFKHSYFQAFFFFTFSDKPWLCFLRHPVILIIRVNLFFPELTASVYIYLQHTSLYLFVNHMHIHNTHTIKLIQSQFSLFTHIHTYTISFIHSQSFIYITEFHLSFLFC